MVILIFSFKRLKLSTRLEVTFKELSTSIVKTTEIIEHWIWSSKEFNMCVGHKGQVKIEGLTQTQKIPINHLSSWLSLPKESSPEDITHSLSVSSFLHNFLEVISNPKVVTSVIHWLLSWFHLMEKMTIKFIRKILTFYNPPGNC